MAKYKPVLVRCPVCNQVDWFDTKAEFSGANRYCDFCCANGTNRNQVMQIDKWASKVQRRCDPTNELFVKGCDCGYIESFQGLETVVVPNCPIHGPILNELWEKELQKVRAENELAEWAKAMGCSCGCLPDDWDLVAKSCPIHSVATSEFKDNAEDLPFLKVAAEAREAGMTIEEYVSKKYGSARN
jgi:hypothetical protein